MDVDLIFKIAAIGILVTLFHQILKQAGREEQGFLITLIGLLIVLSWIVPCIEELFQEMYHLFQL